MKNKFKKYYISHHVITLKRFVTHLIKYLHNIKHFYICKTYFKYYLIRPHKRPHNKPHKETYKKPHKKAGPMKSGLKGHYMTAHTMIYTTGHKNMT